MSSRSPETSTGVGFEPTTFGLVQFKSSTNWAIQPYISTIFWWVGFFLSVGGHEQRSLRPLRFASTLLLSALQLQMSGQVTTWGTPHRKFGLPGFGVPIQRSWVQIPLQSKFSDFDYSTIAGVILTFGYIVYFTVVNIYVFHISPKSVPLIHPITFVLSFNVHTILSFKSLP